MATTIGFLNLSLHAHLPYVVNHGTWPHGLEWLLEAATETYLPLLRMLDRLDREGSPTRLSMDFSPVLLEQLAHPVFQAELPQYLQRKLQYAREDEAFFQQARELHFADVARFWQGRYQQALDDLRRMRGDLIGSFRRLEEQGRMELLTCAATHGYQPLLGTDESVRAQIRMAVRTHRRHFGRAPRGIWLPECGYRPAGYWQAAVAPEGEERPYPSFHRIGIEQALEESGLTYFVVDAHLIEGSNRFASPYGSGLGSSARHQETASASANGGAGQLPGEEKLYRAYAVGPDAEHAKVHVFPRDPRTGFQVWSGDAGYPADPRYLDFHKKRWPGGHRYWEVTGPHTDLGAKQPYHPELAEERTRAHAEHFVSLVRSALQSAEESASPKVLCAPFDAELFGHWWFEGVSFLEHVLRALGTGSRGVDLITGSAYLRLRAPEQAIEMPEGSWGAGGDNRVWLNADTSWTYALLYRCEHEVRELCTDGGWRDGALGERLARQMCRELLLLESSDWPFLITTGAARDYAEQRFQGHVDSYRLLRSLWTAFLDQGRQLSEEQTGQLVSIEKTDDLFADVNPEFWVRGAKAMETPAAS